MTNKSSDTHDEGGGRSDTTGGKMNGSNYLKLQQSTVIRSNIHGISQLLNTGLNAESLDICIKLVEAGVHPQALAEVITQIRREVAILHDHQQQHLNDA